MKKSFEGLKLYNELNSKEVPNESEWNALSTLEKKDFIESFDQLITKYITFDEYAEYHEGKNEYSQAYSFHENPRIRKNRRDLAGFLLNWFWWKYINESDENECWTAAQGWKTWGEDIQIKEPNRLLDYLSRLHLLSS